MRSFLIGPMLLSVIFQTHAVLGDGVSRLINGTIAAPGTYQEVVSITTGVNPCTATIVGPRVFITAAHCGATGATSNFSINGKSYSAKLQQSPLYTTNDHDISVGMTTEDITGIPYAIVGGAYSEGLQITLLGYGCYSSDPSEPTDGKLRYGQTVTVSTSGYDMISKTPGGALVCYSDSGGPAYILQGDKHLLLGISTKGNMKDSNYDLRTDITETQSFLKNFATTNSVVICGINSDCSSTTPAPTCTMTASPTAITIGTTVTLSMTTAGQVTLASINGVSVPDQGGQTTVTPTAAGDFTAKGSVQGPGGNGSCQASYHVANQPSAGPTCTLAANPDQIKLGDSLTLEITTTGIVTSATIEGASVSFPVGTTNITPAALGAYTASGAVSGPGGSSNCSTQYVVANTGPEPTIPNFSVVPSYCGKNTFASSTVQTVCIGIVKKSDAIQNLRIGRVLLITYQNGAKEVLPIIANQQQPADNNGQAKVALTLYANNSLAMKDYMVLDTRIGTITENATATPLAIEGQSTTGQYFS